MKFLRIFFLSFFVCLIADIKVGLSQQFSISENPLIKYLIIFDSEKNDISSVKFYTANYEFGKLEDDRTLLFIT